MCMVELGFPSCIQVLISGVTKIDLVSELSFKISKISVHAQTIDPSNTNLPPLVNFSHKFI